MICPLVYGWKLIGDLRSVPRNLKCSIYKRLVNQGSWSLTLFLERSIASWYAWWRTDDFICFAINKYGDEGRELIAVIDSHYEAFSLIELGQGCNEVQDYTFLRPCASSRGSKNLIESWWSTFSYSHTRLVCTYASISSLPRWEAVWWGTQPIMYWTVTILFEPNLIHTNRRYG